MPVIGGTGSFNTGKDLTLIVVGPYGPLTLTNPMMFEAKQMTSDITVDPLNGPPMFADLPKGWSGSFELERGDDSVDILFGAIEQAWYVGATYNVGMVYQYVTETNGTQSIFQFTGVSFKLSDSGSWSSDKSVKVKVEFRAAERIVLA